MRKLISLSDLKENRVYIYGAGMVAELFIDEVRAFSDIEIVALVVSSNAEDIDSVQGVRVISVNEINSGIPIVIATLSNSHAAIGENLLHHGINDCYAVSEKMFQAMRRHFVPESHDRASIKIRLNEMRKIVGIQGEKPLFVTDADITSGTEQVVSSASFSQMNVLPETVVYIFLIDWDFDWRALFFHALEVCERLVVSYRYKYLKDQTFRLIDEAKKMGLQLSAQEKIYRDKRDFFTEDTLLFFEKRSPLSLRRDQLCSGCGMCAIGCPAGALRMIPDRYGYKRPIVDEQKCICCGKCLEACPVYEKKVSSDKVPSCYVYEASDEIRFKSSSGGAFTVLADWMFSQGGYVCGAAWNKDFSVSHLLTGDSGELDRLRKSKYIRSDIMCVLPEIKRLLDKENKVLFVGCPCQIGALKKYLKKNDGNLYTVDLICAQAPSEMLFRKYLEENDKECRIAYCEFRDKERGWRPDAFSIVQTDGKKIIYGFEDKYQTAYHTRLMMPIACEHCAYLTYPRIGDLTIGDAWGIGKYAPEFDDGKGTSVLMINHEKGKILLNALEKSKKLIQEIPFAWTASNRTTDWIVPHPNRDRFYKEFFELGFNKAVEDAEDNLYDIGLVGNWSYPNYGSELTYYALFFALKKMGYSVLMIEWAEDCIWDSYGVTQLFENEPYEWYEIAYPIKNHSEFYALNEKCRMFIQGSDQLLHPYLYKMFGKNVVLDWVDYDKKKIGYAMSFGHENVEYTDEELRDIKFELNLFDAVSVREESGKRLMKNLFGIESEQVLDPVFFHEKEFYEKLAGKYIHPEHTVFSYMLDVTDGVVGYLEDFAKFMGLKLRLVSDAAKACHVKDQACCEFGLSEEAWLGGIISSDFVVADSFHGMCIAVICQKNFVALCNENRGATRFQSILKILGLEDRLIYHIHDLKKKNYVEEPIDYESVNKVILKEREKALSWLANALEMPHQRKVSEEYIYMQDKFRDLEKQMYIGD